MAAVGVAIAVFNVVSKVFNFPLLNVTTSLVAEEEAGGRLAAGGAKSPPLPSPPCHRPLTLDPCRQGLGVQRRVGVLFCPPFRLLF